jgi:hypothetical protein
LGLWAIVLVGIAAAPARALHRETPGAIRLTSGAAHVLPPTRSWGGYLVFASDVDLLSTGSRGRQLYRWSLLDFDCNRGTTRRTTPCPDPTRPSLVRLTDGQPLGAPDNGSVERTGSIVVFDADGAYGSEGGPQVERRQIFQLDLVGGALTQITRSGGGDSTRPSIDRFGNVIAFDSTAPLLGAAGPRSVPQVFALVRSRAGARTLVQLTAGAGPSTAPMVDAAGERIVLESTADLLGDGRDTGVSQIFVAAVDRDTLRFALSQITRGDGPSRRPYVAGAGAARVVFESLAEDLPGTDGGGSQIYSAPIDAASFPPITQHTTRDHFGDCTAPVVDDVDGRQLAIVCTGDPLRNGTTGRRVFVLSTESNALVQLTGRGDVRGPLAPLGSFLVALASTVDMSVLSPTFEDVDLGRTGACDHQVQVLAWFDQEAGLPTWRGATQLGQLPPDLLPVPGGGDPPGLPHPTAETFAGNLACRVAPCTAPAACDDADPCTGVEACLNRACVPGTPLCDDGDPCTGVETCERGTGCRSGVRPVCDDESPCTFDTCVAGRGCVSVNLCDDNDACNGVETCDPGTGACAPGAPLDCDDRNPCTAETCDPVLGCTVTAAPGPCDDGSACTVGDTCQGGRCLGAPVPCSDDNACNGVETCDPGTGGCLPGIPPNCDDRNPCTTESCHPLFACVVTPRTGPCDDRNACTTGDSCVEGICTGTPTVRCDDGDVCDGVETCDPATGTCVAGPVPVCNDANRCTDDACHPVSGCVYTPNTAPCFDGNACTTNDICSGGVCTGILVLCSDGDLCNGTETCDPHTVSCGPGLPLNCDDGDACTADSCDPVAGCRHVPIAGCGACGLGGIREALASLRTLLRETSAEALGGRRKAQRLRRLVAGSLRLVERLQRCEPPCARRVGNGLRKVCERMRTFEELIVPDARHAVAPEVAGLLLDLVRPLGRCCSPVVL